MQAVLLLILLLFVIVMTWILIRRGELLQKLPRRLRRRPEEKGLFFEKFLLIMIPHRSRERYVSYTVPQLAEYLSFHHPHVSVHIYCIEQTDLESSYSKGLSWNVGLRYLEAEAYAKDSGLVLCDADIIPRKNVDFSCPTLGELKGILWFQNTGGLKLRLGQMLEANGFSSTMHSWGMEDVDMWRRLKHMAGMELVPWSKELEAADAGPAIVLNLEWGKLSPEELIYYRNWYWGDSSKKLVHMIAQSDEEFGVRPMIEAHSKENWYSTEALKKNQTLNSKIEELSGEEYRLLVESDGASSLDMTSVSKSSFSERFAQSAALPANICAWNLKFSSLDVLRSTPKIFLESELLRWYLDTK
jgi:hypothetical protein